MSTATGATRAGAERAGADPRLDPRLDPRDGASAGDARPSPLAELQGILAQLRAIGGFYVQTRIDRVRVAVTRAITTVMLLAVAAVIGFGLLVAAAFFLVVGAVQALASVVHAPGVASLIVGGALLAIAFAAVFAIRAKLRGALKRKLAAKYRDHYVRQRDELGADVAQMAGRPHASLGADGGERRP